jgi:hypothetical protein
LNKLSHKVVAVLGALSIMALAPGTSLAQDGKVVPCPHPLAPVSITRTGTMASTPDRTGFPIGPLTGRYNQTVDNQMFRETIRFRDPSTKECCQLDKLPRNGYYGTLTVRYKALDEGPKGSSSSYNDTGGLVYQGHSVAGQSGYIYPQGASVSAGQIAVHTYFLTAAMVQSGEVSFAVQDDSAVVDAKLVVPGGCCLQPTPI